MLRGSADEPAFLINNAERERARERITQNALSAPNHTGV